MKLDRFTSCAPGGTRLLVALMSGAAMSFAAVFACGCSPTTSAQAPQTASLYSVASVASVANFANVPNVAGTTNLMSAELPGPAPKVGKAHLAVDEADSDMNATNTDDESAPKEARRSDGSHRAGGFGTSSK